MSHTWRYDEEGRSTHDRARSLKIALQSLGWNSWFDEDDMRAGNMDYAMSVGIENAQAVLICVTRKYLEKVNFGLRESCNRDNCATEWSCAVIRRKAMIPIIFESCMLDTSRWPCGPVATYLGSHRYIDASGDDWHAIATEVCCTLSSMSLFPRGQKPILEQRDKWNSSQRRLQVKQKPREDIELKRNLMLESPRTPRGFGCTAGCIKLRVGYRRRLGPDV